MIPKTPAVVALSAFALIAPVADLAAAGPRLDAAPALGALMAVRANTALLAAAKPSPLKAEMDHAIAGRKTLARGTVAARKSAVVSIGGRRNASTGDLAAVVFREHTKLAGELAKGKGSLFGDPIVTDEVAELETSTIFTRTTKFVVNDPTELRKVSPMFASMRTGKARGSKLAELNPSQRAAFTAFKHEVDAMPAGHPLRKAAKKGEQALMDAIGDGVGEVSITTTSVVPKHALARDKAGHVVAPKRNKKGVYADAVSSVNGQTAVDIKVAPTPEPESKESGQCEHTTKFLAGFTEGYRWEKRFRIDFGSHSWFRIIASAWYDYGLRFPIEVTATQTPKKIVTNGEDVAHDYEVSLTAKTKDAGESFYQAVGLESSEINDGKELVLGAGVSVNLHLEIFGGVALDTTIPKKDGLSFDQDFVPPLAACGDNCGIQAWIPAELTKTEIDLGVVKGSARGGVKFGGTGEIDIDFQALVQNGDASPHVVESWKKGEKNEAEKKHELSFTSSTQERKRIASIAPLKRKNQTKSFGYRLSNPRYTWNVALVPGVRADIEITQWPFKDKFPLGPWWLDEFAVELGSLPFGPHEGTHTKAETLHGTKSW